MQPRGVVVGCIALMCYCYFSLPPNTFDEWFDVSLQGALYNTIPQFLKVISHRRRPTAILIDTPFQIICPPANDFMHWLTPNRKKKPFVSSSLCSWCAMRRKHNYSYSTFSLSPHIIATVTKHCVAVSFTIYYRCIAVLTHCLVVRSTAQFGCQLSFAHNRIIFFFFPLFSALKFFWKETVKAALKLHLKWATTKRETGGREGGREEKEGLYIKLKMKLWWCWYLTQGWPRCRVIYSNFFAKSLWQLITKHEPSFYLFEQLHQMFLDHYCMFFLQRSPGLQCSLFVWGRL